MDLRDFDSIVTNMSEQELDGLQAAIDERRGAFLQRMVVERRDHSCGVLQLETRTYARKDGEHTERGPYWYFYYQKGTKQHTMYVGNTDAPEDVVDRKLLGIFAELSSRASSSSSLTTEPSPPPRLPAPF